MRKDRDVIALEIAKSVSGRTTCLRRAVGCVLTDSFGHILATGYNGVARGVPHCNEVIVPKPYRDACRELVLPSPKFPHACPGAHAASGTQLDGCHAIHAEQNALLQCGDVEKICSCYVTHSPCITCVKLLMNTGCIHIIFEEEYAHDSAAKALWTQAGHRTWTKLVPPGADEKKPGM